MDYVKSNAARKADTSGQKSPSVKAVLSFGLFPNASTAIKALHESQQTRTVLCVYAEICL